MRLLKLSLCAVSALGLAACSSGERVARYRFTVEVVDNGRLVSGSSVQEEHCVFNDGFMKGMGNALSCGVKGEAVVVDLGRKGQLFVLLVEDRTRERVSDTAWGIFEGYYRKLLDQPNLTAAVFDELAAQKKPVSIPAPNMPLMVRFSDTSNPRTAERVDTSDLSRNFGPGVSLKGASVVITTDPLTTGIEKWLPWLTAPHKLAGIIYYDGYPNNSGPIPALPQLLYNDFWDNMQ